LRRFREVFGDLRAAMGIGFSLLGSKVKSFRISLAGTTPTLDTIAFLPGVTRANNAILGLFGTPAGNVTVASGFAAGTADLVIDVTGWWR
jgi:hypothetical protein